MKIKTINRIEVIGEQGRIYVNNNCEIELSYQDDKQTLKIFVKKRELEKTPNFLNSTIEILKKITK